MACVANPESEELPRGRAFDEAVDQFLESIRNPILDRCMYTLSSAADHSLLWFGIGGIRALRAAISSSRRSSRSRWASSRG